MDGRGIKRIIAKQREEVEFLLNSGPVRGLKNEKR